MNLLSYQYTAIYFTFNIKNLKIIEIKTKTKIKKRMKKLVRYIKYQFQYIILYIDILYNI